jgi:hypothetical protein
MKSITLYAVGLIWMLSSSQAYAHESWRKTDNNARHFTENKGQVTDQYLAPRADIDFKLSAGNGLNVFIGKGHISYQWAKPQATTTDAGSGLEHTTYELYRMEVVLLGANKEARIQAEEKQPGYERYFQPWVNTYNSNYGVKAHHYSRVTYRDVYPHIDWVFYFNDKGQLEHDFVVRPGGKVSDIKMQYRGAGKIALTANGSLSATTAMGTITEQAPIAHDATGRRVPVRFVLTKDVLQFDVSAYSGTLTIDPVVEWGTYFGGAADDVGLAIETDRWGNIYLAGRTQSVANISTTGAHQSIYGAGNNDAFLSKWDSSGALLWASYYGGSADDVARGVACDSMGNVYIGGHTNSVDGITTPGSSQEVKGGNPAQARYDAFLVKFDSAAVRQWGTYFGGSNQEAQSSFGLTINRANDIIIAGNTLSVDLPATPGTHQFSKAGSATTNDVFITKYNSTGQRLWTTYFGGSSHDNATTLTTDTFLNIYVGGYTTSSDGIATSVGYQIANGGGEDAFIAKFTDAGIQVWGTYFGGLAIDRASTIQINGNKLYVGGLTLSNTGIATPNAHQSAFSGGAGGDGFLGCFDFNGALDWCTYYGGPDVETVEKVAISHQGDIYISGQTNSASGIATPGAYKDVLDNITDVYIAKFTAGGVRVWGTYYGGLDPDEHGKIACYDSKFVLAGFTYSSTGIATNNSHQPMTNGGSEVFLVTFNDCYNPILPFGIVGDSLVCSFTEQTYSVEGDTAASTYTWLLPPGWSGTSSNESIQVFSGNTSGVVKVIAGSACGGISDTQTLFVEVVPTPEPEIVKNDLTLSTTQSYDTYQWSYNGSSIPGATQPTHVAFENGMYGLQVTATNGCVGNATDITIEDINFIENINLPGCIRTYPNPASSKIFIDAQCRGETTLINAQGREVIQGFILNHGINTLNTSELSKGIYFLKISSTCGSYIQKIILM